MQPSSTSACLRAEERACCLVNEPMGILHGVAQKELPWSGDHVGSPYSGREIRGWSHIFEPISRAKGATASARRWLSRTFRAKMELGSQKAGWASDLAFALPEGQARLFLLTSSLELPQAAASRARRLPVPQASAACIEGPAFDIEGFQSVTLILVVTATELPCFFQRGQ